jgi:hypothetical protein
MKNILKLSNLNKPSHPNWKKIADIALYMLMAELPIITMLPVSDTTKLWITLGLTQGTVLIKAISKFTLDPDYVDNTLIEDSTDSK